MAGERDRTMEWTVSCGRRAASACLSLSYPKTQHALTQLMFLLLFYPVQILRLNLENILLCPTLAGPVKALATPTTPANTNTAAFAHRVANSCCSLLSEEEQGTHLRAAHACVSVLSVCPN